MAKALLFVGIGVLSGWALTTPAQATDEIQVYNADIAAPGQLTIQQHLNYVGDGLKQAPFPEALFPITA